MMGNYSGGTVLELSRCGDMSPGVGVIAHRRAEPRRERSEEVLFLGCVPLEEGEAKFAAIRCDLTPGDQYNLQGIGRYRNGGW